MNLHSFLFPTLVALFYSSKDMSILLRIYHEKIFIIRNKINLKLFNEPKSSSSHKLIPISTIPRSSSKDRSSNILTRQSVTFPSSRSARRNSTKEVVASACIFQRSLFSLAARERLGWWWTKRGGWSISARPPKTLEHRGGRIDDRDSSGNSFDRSTLSRDT